MNARGGPLRATMARLPRPFLREVTTVCAGAVVVLFARTSLADHYVVPSGSMEPTVLVGDRILVDRLAFGVRAPLAAGYLFAGEDPRPGDVVVLASPEDGRTLLKRVVAVPGDTVSVQDGVVRRGPEDPRGEAGGAAPQEWLGGAAHELSLDRGGGPDLAPVVVPAGMFLVLGDHRGDSHDGRAFGFVPRDAIHGRARAVFARAGRPVWRSL